MLGEFGLQLRSRLFDDSRERLLSMSISECYALMLVSHQPFKLVMDGLGVTDRTVGVRNAQKLLHSVASMTASWWQSSIRFKFQGNPSFVFTSLCKLHESRLYRRFTDHFSLIDDLCFIDEEAALNLTDESGRLLPLNQMLRSERDSVIAVYELSKLNTHRLRELMVQGLIYQLHLVWVSELSLERTHQIHKRAMAGHSNNRRVHVSVMNSARFNDWQRRPHSAIEVSERDVVVDTRLPTRLLTGITLKENCSRVVLQRARQYVGSVLKPHGIVYEELCAQELWLLSVHKSSDRYCAVIFILAKSLSSPTRFLNASGVNVAQL